MLSFFERFVAFRYLRSKREEVFISIITVISLLSVAISVMVLNMVMAIMTGFETELQKKLLDTNAHILVRRIGGPIRDWESLQEKVAAIPGVEAAFPYTYSQIMISSEGGSRGLIVRGISDQESPRKKLVKLLNSEKIVESIFNPQPAVVNRPDGTVDQVNLPPLVIGKELAKNLQLYVGSLVTVFSPQFSASPRGLIPKLRRFQVVGIYSSGLHEYESSLAFTSLSAAQKFFDLKSQVTGIEASVFDFLHAQKTADDVRVALSSEDNSYYVSDWTEPNKALWEAIRHERKVYFLVLLLLVLLASFTIVSTLVMVVMEKNKDIAVMKSLGCADASIIRIFLLQGVIVGFVGVVGGSLAGYLGCLGLDTFGYPLDAAVFGLDQVPIHMEPLNFLIVAVAGFVITSLSGIYPALRAAKVRPAEVLRYE